MEEMYWRQFWETGNVTDYLAYRNIFERNISEGGTDPESEDAIESDYSDRDGFAGIAYR